MRGFAPLLLISSFVSLAAGNPPAYGPLHVSGRWIKNHLNQTITMVGTNWPGHMEPMIPEGLQYSSYKDIIRKIKALGMNTVRITFATQMVDEILDRGRDVTLRETFVNSLGAVNGTRVLAQVLRSNRDFSANTTRMEVFGMIAKEMEKAKMYLHMDNHVSKAGWCCSAEDGNSWFGDLHFDVEKWKRGLAYIAGKAPEWPSLHSIGLRNELRATEIRNITLPYDWADWNKHMTSAATAVHTKNEKILIFFSGLDFDETLSPLPVAGPLTPSTEVFHPSEYAWGQNTVLELHLYSFSSRINATDCKVLRKTMYRNGFNALDGQNPDVVHQFPVLMTEFGFAQDNTTYREEYAQCLKKFLPERRAGWTSWGIAGSFYTRSGVQDMDDTWGLLSHEWNSWRSPAVIENYYKPMVKSSLQVPKDLCGI